MESVIFVFTFVDAAQPARGNSDFSAADETLHLVGAGSSVVARPAVASVHTGVETGPDRRVVSRSVRRGLSREIGGAGH